MESRIKLRLSATLPLIMTMLVATCATNPATGRKEFSLMSEAQEIQIGQQMDAEVRQQMGLYEDASLQRYVQDIGLRLARASERPGLPWHFTVVDIPAVNAFALPGGYIYLTRGILPFLDNEAELAGVLGHEIGHVTARHAAQQYTQATSAGVGLTLLSIFVPEARPLQGLAETALGVLFMKYGRDDELQADTLGVEYTAKSGWDPAGVAGMLNTLARLDEASGNRKGVPNWLATHPAAADRVQALQPAIKEVLTNVAADLAVNEAALLERLDGLVYGDSPSEGMIRGSEFLHPVLRFALTFPSRWEILNTRTQVAAKAPEQEQYLMLQLVPNARGGSLEQIALTTMSGAGFRRLQGAPTRINGLNAYEGTYQGTMQGLGQVTAIAAHIQHGDRVYLLAGLTPTNMFERAHEALSRTLRSFRPLSETEASQIRPHRVDIQTVRPGDTWERIAQRTGGIVKPETLAIMNDYEPTQPPRSGERIKVVVEG